MPLLKITGLIFFFSLYKILEFAAALVLRPPLFFFQRNQQCKKKKQIFGIVN